MQTDLVIYLFSRNDSQQEKLIMTWVTTSFCWWLIAVPWQRLWHCVEVKTITRHLRRENGRRIDHFTINNDDLRKTCLLFWFPNSMVTRRTHGVGICFLELPVPPISSNARTALLRWPWAGIELLCQIILCSWVDVCPYDVFIPLFPVQSNLQQNMAGSVPTWSKLRYFSTCVQVSL